jgi:hypothetical protein
MKNNIADRFHSINKSVLSIFKVDELTKYYIKVTNVLNNRYVLTLVSNILEASVLADEQVYEIVSDLRSGNRDISVFEQFDYPQNKKDMYFFTHVHVENINSIKIKG